MSHFSRPRGPSRPGYPLYPSPCGCSSVQAPRHISGLSLPDCFRKQASACAGFPELPESVAPVRISDGPRQWKWQNQRKRQGVADEECQLRWGNVADGLQQYGQDFQICWDIGLIRVLTRSGRGRRIECVKGWAFGYWYWRHFIVFVHSHR